MKVIFGLLLVAAVSATSFAASQNRELDATALTLMTGKGKLDVAKLQIIRAELAAIDKLGVPDVLAIHQSRSNITIDLELTSAAATKIKKSLGATIDLQDGALVTLKQTSILAVDKIDQKLKPAALSVSFGDASTPASLTLEFDWDVSETLNLLAIQSSFLKTGSVKSISFSGGFSTGGSFGGNPPPIRKLSDDGVKSTYAFWKGHGDCMAGCIGTTYKIDVLKEKLPFLASLILPPALPAQ